MRVSDLSWWCGIRTPRHDVMPDGRLISRLLTSAVGCFGQSEMDDDRRQR
jgi:hypothetical protein